MTGAVQALRFLLVGGLATLAYAAIAAVFGSLGLRPAVASFVAHAIIAVPTFFGHRLVTFRVAGPLKLREVFSFGFSQCAGAVTAALVAELLKIAGAPGDHIATYVVAAAAGAVASYAVMKVHTFRSLRV